MSLYVNGVAGKEIGSRTDIPQANILLGKKGGMTGEVYVTLTGMEDLAYLKDGNGQIRIVIHHIPDNEWEPLSGPTLISDESVDFAESINITLNSFGPSDAYTIRILNPNY